MPTSCAGSATWTSRPGPGRGDGAKHGGTPDRGDAGWRPGPRDVYWPAFDGGMDPEDAVRIKSRDFH